MTHPLTNEICETIYCTWPEEHEAPMVCDNMRCSADWQLEQMIKWINEAIFEQSTCFDIESLPEELKKAMRPQEDN